MFGLDLNLPLRRKKYANNIPEEFFDPLIDDIEVWVSATL